jgi:sugar phosphate isomerase/epimerase
MKVRERKDNHMAIQAIQQIMLGSVTGTEKEARETLHRIKAAGYEGIELNTFMIEPTPLVVRMLTKAAGMPTGKGGKLDWKTLVEEAGLCVVSLHENLGTIEEHPEAVIEKAKKYQTKNIVLTGMYRFDYSDAAQVKELVQRLNRAGETLHQAGLQFLYHNHNCEFLKLSTGKCAYDHIIEETNPEYVNFEFDSYWPTEAGVDVLSLMERLGERMKLYHITDRGSRLTSATMTPILTSDCVELGTGNMNLEAMLAKAKKAGVEAVVLESHKNWIHKSPLESMEISGKYLQEHL